MVSTCTDGIFIFEYHQIITDLLYSFLRSHVLISFSLFPFLFFSSRICFEGMALTAANTLANTGLPSTTNRSAMSNTNSHNGNTIVIVSDGSVRKKPSAIVTGESDSDSDSEDEAGAGASTSSLHSSDSASGVTDGTYSTSFSTSATGMGRELRAESLQSDGSLVSSLGSDLEMYGDRAGRDVDGKKKKTKPSARKAANLSGTLPCCHRLIRILCIFQDIFCSVINYRTE